MSFPVVWSKGKTESYHSSFLLVWATFDRHCSLTRQSRQMGLWNVSLEMSLLKSLHMKAMPRILGVACQECALELPVNHTREVTALPWASVSSLEQWVLH